METDQLMDSIHKVSIVINALQSGTLQLRAEDEEWTKPLLNLPRGLTGLVDISSLSPEILATVRATALAIQLIQQEDAEDCSAEALSSQEAQCELFALFERLFRGLVKLESHRISSISEIKERILVRVQGGDSFSVYHQILEELSDFYINNASSLFRAAREIGGVKSVAGGQKTFGASALTATRISGLYCDTQLIPDPIYPFLAGDLHLNAAPLQLAIALFYILPLRPLVDARLPEPPIFVFPSFEEVLEKKDAETQAGIASLILKIVGPHCNANLSSIDELLEYAKKEEIKFLQAVNSQQLFVPPGANPGDIRSNEQNIKLYLEGLKGIRNDKEISFLAGLPPGVLLLNGILERVRPIFHLLENANELAAQPLLSQNVHWFYFERCAHAESLELINKKILPKESLDILRALQDDSLTWLANIPIEGLTELRLHMEHVEIREQLKKCTAQLVAAGDAEKSEMIKEVRHGLELLVQRQRKAIKEIETKYSPKKWSISVGGVLSTVAGASVYFMPTLAAATGVSAPVATVVAGMAGGGLAFAKEMASEFAEKRNIRKSMLGLLAAARDA